MEDSRLTEENKEEIKATETHLRSLITNLDDPMMLRATETKLREKNEKKQQGADPIRRPQEPNQHSETRYLNP